MRTKTFKELVLTRTVSPSVHPRLASGDATDFFLASALSSPTDLAASRWKRLSMRPIDICHPIELRAPAPRAFPTHSRYFRSGDAPRSLGLRAVNWGTERFTAFVMTASADRFSFTTLFTTRALFALRRFVLRVTSVGVFFPRRCCDRASDTPVVTSCGSSSRLTHFRECCSLSPYALTPS
jgi:hypothetical protein